MGYLVVAIMFLAVCLVIQASAAFRDRKAFLLSPTSVFAFAWAASAFVYCFGDDFLRPDTINALLTIYLSFILGSSWIMWTVGRRLRITAPSESEPGSFVLLVLVLQVLAAVAAGAHLYYAWVQSGYAGITAVRGVLANQAVDSPILFRVLGQLRYINYVAPIAMFSMGRRKGVIALSIFLACLYPLFGMERSGLMRIGLLLAFSYLFVRVKSLDDLVKMGLVCLGFAVPLVVVIPIMRGQAEGANPYMYVAGAWSGFDNFVSGSGIGLVSVLDDSKSYITRNGFEEGSAPLGMLTATDIYRACLAVDLCHEPVSLGTEYIYKPVFTNTYTIARSFYQDWGPLGSAIMAATFGAALAFFYLYGFGRGAFGLYLSAYTAYTCIMSVLANTFLIRDVVITAAMHYGARWIARRFHASSILVLAHI